MSLTASQHWIILDELANEMKALTVIDPTKIRVIIGVAQLSSGTMVSDAVIVTRVGFRFTPKLNAPQER